VTILQFFLWSLLKVAVVTVVMLLGVAYTVLLERKLVGRIQNRWGPSRVGPFGLLQPLVDGAKSFLKEDLIPSGVYRPLYLLAPIIRFGGRTGLHRRYSLRRAGDRTWRRGPF
jgi:NADH-quinone oxidoreductase subunit H